MRIIAESTLDSFVANRLERGQREVVQDCLDVWCDQVKKASWKTSAELKRQFKSASVVSAERVVFNIKGNDYRLVVAIHYANGVVLVKWIGTHREYDEIDVKEVKYDKQRYLRKADQDRGGP